MHACNAWTGLMCNVNVYTKCAGLRMHGNSKHEFTHAHNPENQGKTGVKLDGNNSKIMGWTGWLIKLALQSTRVPTEN